MSTPPELRSRQLPRLPSSPRSGRFRQRGAAAVLAAVSLLMLVPVLALAINIGQLYYAQRDLEKQATLAALSAVQVSSGCANNGGGLPADLDTVRGEVIRVIAANSVDGPASVQGLLTGINGSPAVEIGRIETSTGHRIFVPLPAGSAARTAIRVNLSRPQPVPFINLYGGGGMLYASATAEQPAVASFRLGTTAAALDGGALNMLLGALLGTNVNLTVLNYEGLAQARVKLGPLLVAAGVNDLHDLLTLQTDLPGALQILGNALTATGDLVSGTAGGLISGLAGQSYASSTPVKAYFGEVFNNAGNSLNPGVSDLLSAVPLVDGLSLLNALGQSASKGGTIKLPITAGIGDIVGLGVFIKIIEPEKFAGPGRAGYDNFGDPYTFAQASQLVTQIRLQLDLNVLGLLSIADIHVAIDLQGANGLSELLHVTCPNTSNPNSTAEIKTTASLLTATVGTFTGSATANPPKPVSSGAVANVLEILGIPVLEITTTVGNKPFGTTVIQTGSTPTPAKLPDIPSDQPLTTLVTSLLSSNLTLNVLGILPVPVGDILNAILTPVTTLLDGVLDPLLKLLGLKVGIANVTLESITTPRPTLVNTCLPGTVNCQ